MSTRKKLRIAIVSAFYSRGMGYMENCLPRALAQLGHEVHLIASTYNVYGNEATYDNIYGQFLGPRRVPVGSFLVDGYEVHRLDATLLAGYVRMKGLIGILRELSPTVVYSTEIASLQSFSLAARGPFSPYPLFSGTTQTMSAMKAYMKEPRGHFFKKAWYRLTRTLPTFLASMAVEKCYAATPDCMEVATTFYGVPRAKVELKTLGTTTDLFHPVESDSDRAARGELRQQLGFSPEDIVCIYTGKFASEKNPLVLAQAIGVLSQTDPRFKGLFIGDGIQKDPIAAQPNTKIIPFMTHEILARHYRAADIAVWPRQESMSMLDAASSGLPVVVSNRMGAPERIEGNGKVYKENDAASLVEALVSFSNEDQRRAYGAIGRRKMLEGFSWIGIAQSLEADFLRAVLKKRE
jgi:glycosyltransferase involved in cell wall biosynthesis